jgi:hypothetical protein
MFEYQENTMSDLVGTVQGYRCMPSTPPPLADRPIKPLKDKKPLSYDWEGARKRLFHYVAPIALVAFALVSGTAQAGSNTASVAATIQSPVTLSSSANLGFGSIFSDVTACNIGVSAAGVRTVLTGNCSLGSATGVSVSNWMAHGTPGASFTMTGPTSTTLTSGGNSMVLDTFVNTTVPSILDALNGNASWQTGATLHLLANQASGVYSGSISETANY